MKRALALAATAGGLVMCGIAGCGNASGSSTSPSTAPDVEGSAKTASTRPILAMAREIGENGDLAVDRLAEQAASDAGDAAFQLFLITEPEFVRAVIGASREEHLAFAEPIDRELKEIRPFLNAAVEAAVARARDGDPETAHHALATLDRIAEVSARDGQLAIGRLVAERLKEQVAEARAEIAALQP